MVYTQLPAVWITMCQTQEIKAQKAGFAYQVKVGDQAVLAWTDTYERRLAERGDAAIALCKELLGQGCQDGEWDMAYCAQMRKRLADLEQL